MSVDNAQYEKVVTTYDSILQTAVRRCDTANLLHTLGSVEGKRILDLATGTGFFARTLSKLGAKHVNGVDVSQSMLEAARKVTEDDPQIPEGVVEYELGDVFKPLTLLNYTEASCDLVTGAWCLNYAGDQAMMDQALQNIAKYLRPGGRFVGVIPNDNMPWLHEDENYYGFSYKKIDSVKDGKVCKLTLHAKEQPVSFNAYMLNHCVFETAAKSAGLADITLANPTVKPKFEGAEDEDYWDSFLARPLFTIMTAAKPEPE
ncbi:methyltransferase-like protein [Diaporthe amygdali]|uniref:methyltransferase-like protein n=1 Tax=Phomopsis amygdali TaxID=1214568 RepID=UPI0022FE180B|nr:methyltransferase-like protein [Diaporthe amygdali]KAJ0116975.1 methyltransferase-like protein [Diaporthe amygdali]